MEIKSCKSKVLIFRRCPGDSLGNSWSWSCKRQAVYRRCRFCSLKFVSFLKCWSLMLYSIPMVMTLTFHDHIVYKHNPAGHSHPIRTSFSSQNICKALIPAIPFVIYLIDVPKQQLFPTHLFTFPTSSEQTSCKQQVPCYNYISRGGRGGQESEEA